MPAKEVSHWKEYRAALSATLIMASAGTAIGWTSPTLPVLSGPDSPIPITPDQGSWLASLMILFSTLSALPAAYFTEIWGRKITMLLAAIPYILSWVLVITADSVIQLYFSRLLAGIGYGIIYTVGPMYLGEISSDAVRGSLAILITVMNKLGILLQYCIGPYVSMKNLAWFNLVIPTVFFLTFIWLPESPYYYVKKNRHAEAEDALRRLRSSDEIHIKHEMKKIEMTVSEDMKERGKWIDLFRDVGNRKALKITLVLFATQQVCGSAAVISYAQTIFKQAEGKVDASDASIILGCVQLLVAGSSFFLVDRLGRRPLLLMSSLGVCIMNTIIGAYFFFKDYKQVNMESVGFLPIFAIVIYIIAYTIGLSTVPMAVTSEMFPTNVKSYATSVLQLFVGFSTFTVTKLYQVIADELGTYTAFWSFSVCSTIGLIYIFINLPETKGRSFVDIQHHLRFNTSLDAPRRESDVSENPEAIHLNATETAKV